MDISATTASGAEAYETLTSPFITKRVTINSHTPFDPIEESEESEVYTRSFFKLKKRAKLRIEISDYNDVLAHKIQNPLKTGMTIDSGFTAQETLQMYKAQQKYQFNLPVNKNTISYFNNYEYEV